MNASDALKAHAVEKVERLGKYLDDKADAHVAVSYTHLDVYKRQTIR